MSDLLKAIVLGLVQGLTEFIPVSSSGHLVLVPYLAGWTPPSLAFNVALHFGTFGAVAVFFRRELAAMARGLLGGGQDPSGRVYRRLAGLIVLASLPVAVVGLAFEDAFERVFANPLAAAGFLLVTAGLLVTGEFARNRRARREVARAGQRQAGAGPVWTGDWVGQRPAAGEPATKVDLPLGEDPADPAAATLADVSWRQALAVGLLQVLALFPGVSRSAATISAGMVGGLSREAATRFSFLLSLPALLGAGLLSLPDLAVPGAYDGPAITAGVVASFVSGYAAIRFLVALVAREPLTGFARYTVAASVVAFLGYLMIGPPSTA